MSDGLTRHGAVHLETLTDHGGRDQPGLPLQSWWNGGGMHSAHPHPLFSPPGDGSKLAIPEMDGYCKASCGFREVVFGHDHLHRPSSLYPWQKGVFPGKMLILLSLSSQKRRFPGFFGGTVGKSANYRHYR